MSDKDIAIPDEACEAVAEAIPLSRITAAVKADYHAPVLEDDAVPGLIMEAVRVAAPLIVAAELEAQAHRIDQSIREWPGMSDQACSINEERRNLSAVLTTRAAELRAQPTP